MWQGSKHGNSLGTTDKKWYENQLYKLKFWKLKTRDPKF